ncbi:MAG: LysR family transcriptional regulator [Oscillospiraceae bacterium]|jgi:DNA-binding transcriptional LysR family regulator|nr:LysR family transcriptional regulator [Oscillospiraceae bacterium]
MNLVQMKYIAEVEKTGSITKAAENLFMGQPNLSRSIRELEGELGFSIFRRTAKGMLPTKEGEELLSRARNILGQVQAIENIGKNDAPKRQTLSISVPRAGYISAAFANFTATLDTSRPIDLDYKETNAMRSIDNILTRNYNLGIVRYRVTSEDHFLALFKEKNLKYDEIATINYRILMSGEGPLAGYERLNADQLGDLIELVHGDPYVPSLNIMQVQQAEFTPAVDKRIYIYDRASKLDILSGVANTYMWVCPVSSEVLGRYGLVMKDCSGVSRVYRDVLIRRRRYKMTDLDNAFINEVLKCRRTVQQQDGAV